jgi:hypothetical protein
MTIAVINGFPPFVTKFTCFALYHHMLMAFDLGIADLEAYWADIDDLIFVHGSHP